VKIFRIPPPFSCFFPLVFTAAWLLSVPAEAAADAQDAEGAKRPAADGSTTGAATDELAQLAEDGGPTALAAALDEAAALDLAKALEVAARPDYAIDGAVVAGRWRPAPSEIAQAFQTAVAAPSSSYRDHLLLGLVNDWVKLDPEGVEKAVSSLPDDGRRSDLHEQFNLAMVRFRPADALRSAVEDGGRPGAIKVRDAALALARSDLPAAVNILEEIPPERVAERTSVVAVVAGRWAASAPAEAAAWAGKLAGDAETATAYEEIAYRWSKRDLQACGKWAEKLTPGGARDAALRAIVYEAAGKDIGKAFAWGLLVDDPALRETLLATAVSSWAADDSTAAAAAVHSAPLSDREKKVLGELLGTE
jgi:hypothetical protein